MLGFFYAVITVLAWGTWLAPSQNIPFKNQQIKALLLINEIGAGKGFTIAQLCVVINALIGVYWLKDPQPKTRAAALTLVGRVLAMMGGIVLGNLK